MDTVIRTFEQLAQRLPLELFVFVGAFVEEAVSPIPSFLVLIPAGVAAQVQGFGWWYLPILAVLSACGRILASMLLYVLADKGEDLLFSHGRRFFGLSHEQVERYGRRLGNSESGWLGLFLLNAIPVLPTSLLSLACGFVKIDFRVFVGATFFGAAVNAVIHLSIGYAGIGLAAALPRLESAFRVVAFAMLVLLIGWSVYYQQKRRLK